MLPAWKNPWRVLPLIFIFFVFTSFLGRQSWSSYNQGTSWSSSLNSSRAQPRWLLGIFVGPTDNERRDAIRSTWASRYKHPLVEYRFIMGSLEKSEFAANVAEENATHADIWVLDDYKNEDYQTANHIKNMEFFKYMFQERGKKLRKYDFVSKVDSDTWLSTPLYFDMFMAPRLPGGKEYNRKALTVIGRPMKWDSPYVYASGRLYTLSWPLLEFLAKNYIEDPKPELTEDKLMGMYLYQSQTAHKFVVVELEQAWDIGREGLLDGSNQTTMIHCVKHPDRFAELNKVFDDEGRWNGKKLDGLTNANRTMREVVDKIGPPSDEELKQLREEWSKGAVIDNPYETLDWRMIVQRTDTENRLRFGELYPLNLPGNNASTGIVPHMLKEIDMSNWNG